MSLDLVELDLILDELLPLSISNTPKPTPLEACANQPIVSIEALLGLVKWLKQTTNVAASAPERETLKDGHSNQTSDPKALGARPRRNA